MQDFTPDELKSKIENNATIFLKLWKPGCGACKLSESATDRLEKKHSESIEFFKIDASQYPEMYEIADTEVLPTFFFFKEKTLKGKVIGFKGIKKLEELIGA